MITDRYNQMTEMPSRETLFGNGQPQGQPTAQPQSQPQSPDPSVNRGLSESQMSMMANPQGMPSGVVQTQMQSPQEQARAQQQQSVYGEFEEVLMGMFQLAQSYPQFNKPLAGMAQAMQAMMQQLAVEASQQRIPQSLS